MRSSRFRFWFGITCLCLWIVGCQPFPTPPNAPLPNKSKGNSTIQQNTRGTQSSAQVFPAGSKLQVSGSSMLKVVSNGLEQKGIIATSLEIGQVKQISNTVYIVEFAYKSHGLRYIDVLPMQYSKSQYIAPPYPMWNTAVTVTPTNPYFARVGVGVSAVKSFASSPYWSAEYGVAINKDVSSLQFVFSDHVSIATVSPQSRMFMAVSVYKAPKFSVLTEINVLDSKNRIIKQYKYQ